MNKDHLKPEIRIIDGKPIYFYNLTQLEEIRWLRYLRDFEYGKHRERIPIEFVPKIKLIA